MHNFSYSQMHFFFEQKFWSNLILIIFLQLWDFLTETTRILSFNIFLKSVASVTNPYAVIYNFLQYSIMDQNFCIFAVLFLGFFILKQVRFLVLQKFFDFFSALRIFDLLNKSSKNFPLTKISIFKFSFL